MSRLDTTERPISVAAEAPSVDVTSVVMAAVSSSMPKVMPILAIMPTWIGTSAGVGKRNGRGGGRRGQAGGDVHFDLSPLFTSSACLLRVDSALA